MKHKWDSSMCYVTHWSTDDIARARAVLKERITGVYLKKSKTKVKGTSENDYLCDLLCEAAPRRQFGYPDPIGSTNYKTHPDGSSDDGIDGYDPYSRSYDVKGGDLRNPKVLETIDWCYIIPHEDFSKEEKENPMLVKLKTPNRDSCKNLCGSDNIDHLRIC